MTKTVLVIGSGGREHALAWKLSRSPRVSRVLVAPGNDGFSQAWERWPVNLAQGRSEFVRLAKRARENNVDLVVIGPDNPLAEGITDAFEAVGVLCFGPTRAAAQIEASKAFAKDVMLAAGVPTAKFCVARSLNEAEAFLNLAPWPPRGSGWVIKADGLAFGKGVRVCSSLAEALEATRELLPISGVLIIEECLKGKELSWMAFCDGTRCALLEPARDFKRLGDGDLGPNTGGMGAYSPVEAVSPTMAEQVRERVFLPVLAEMARRGAPFRGLLYAGLMVDFLQNKFWVLEFNSRFGDPETQVLLPRMADDLYDWCEAVAKGDLSKRPSIVSFTKDWAVFVVGAAQGYPEHPRKEDPIEGPLMEATQEPHYFIAGVARDSSGNLVTHGGRVFGALGMGLSCEAARRVAYERLSLMRFKGMQFRTDVARGVK